MARSDWILPRADAACGKVFHPYRQSAKGYRSTSHSLASRLVQMILALYLIPAALIVFLVGTLGVVIVGVVRLFCLSSHAQENPKSLPGRREGDIPNCSGELHDPGKPAFRRLGILPQHLLPALLLVLVIGLVGIMIVWLVSKLLPTP